MSHYLTISYPDSSQNTITMGHYYTTPQTFFPCSFIWTATNYQRPYPELITWITESFLPLFRTNKLLWAISVSTCPEELQPYMILPDDQLTYKGVS